MKNFLLLCLLGISLSAFPSTAADIPSGPPPLPKVLQIFREEVKVGRSAAHVKVEKGYVAAMAKASWPTHYLAMTSVTGPSEAWFLTGYASFAAWEKDRDASDANAALTAELDGLGVKDGEVLSNATSLVALWREDLSPEASVDVAKARYLRVITYRVRPGHENDFAEAAKIVRAAYAKANIASGWAVYQVFGGMPGPTFLVLVPMKSMDEIDAGIDRSGALREAEGPENEKALARLSGEGYNAVESNLFVFSPPMSYPSKEFAARNPGFWTPKPPAKPAAETKKEAKPAEKKK